MGVRAQYGEVKDPIDEAQQENRPVHGLSVELPRGVKLAVDRWAKHLDLTISMQAQPGGQDGHCGNFNGDESDDTLELIKARMGLKVVAEDPRFSKPNPCGDEAERRPGN